MVELETTVKWTHMGLGVLFILLPSGYGWLLTAWIGPLCIGLSCDNDKSDSW